jgi:heptosyltransferase-3
MSAFDIPLVAMYHCLSSSRLTGPLDHPLAFVVDHPRVGADCSESAKMAEIGVETVMARVAEALAARAPQLRERD